MPELGYSVERFGQEKEPIVIIDNFYSDMDRLRKDAIAKTFQRLGPFYPGVRAQASPNYLAERMDLLLGIFRDVFNFKSDMRLTECAYSLVTTPRQDLSPIQCLPHYDGTDEGRLAILHYLSPKNMGGTAFFRHQGTGYETITDDRYLIYKAALEEEVAKNGLPEKNYINDSSRQFKMIGLIDAKPNRCIIYRGVTLHSGFIPDDLPLNTDPATGRLTINTFMSKA